MNTLGLLRNISEDEVEIMRTWRNEPAVRSNMYTQHEISRKEHLDWWAKTKLRPDKKYLMYEMGGKPSGIASFTDLDMRSQNSSWAFYASPSAPKGTGSRMEYLVLEYAFAELKLHKLYCEVLAYNSPVIKMHQKFGFKIEGIFRQQHKFAIDYIDAYRLGILATEWKVRRQEMLEKLHALNKVER